MDSGQSRYGVSNIEYDIITTLSNLLEGVQALETYAQDAQQAGDQDCATIFRTLQDNNRNTVSQLRTALQRHLSGSQ